LISERSSAPPPGKTSDCTEKGLVDGGAVVLFQNQKKQEIAEGRGYSFMPRRLTSNIGNYPTSREE
jgi:hypothetical protein